MVSVDGSVIVQVVNFLLLVWILDMVLYKPVREVLDKRKQKVSGLESDVDAYDLALEEKDNAYITGIKNARIDGQKQKKVLVDLAADEELRIITKINEVAEAELKEAKIKIKSEVDSVRQSLEREVDSFAEAIGHKILGRVV